MKLLHAIRNWWRNLFRKRRFTILNATDNSEEWHIHLSPASILAGLVALLLFLSILILSLIAYTPALEFLPGYRTEADRSRESLVQNIIRLDSMERVMNEMMTYNEHIALVMAGRTPVVRTIVGSDSTRRSKVLVVPSIEDSLLRAQMEGNSEYALSGHAAGLRRQVREAIELVTPVEGIITGHFDIREGRYGVQVATAAADRVVAIDGGTVVMNLWAPETGSTVAVQHTGNLISIYKHLSQSLVAEGQAVRAGELIGYTSDAPEGKMMPLGFELWSSGKPVDPEGYIVF